jgi:uncharacterized protein YjlB
MGPEIYFLQDDGRVPNNSTLPLVMYGEAFEADAAAETAIACFARNGWRGAWVNGIYDFHHYHARSHEVLANLGASVTVQFGGGNGPVLEFAGGAAVVIPAGVGHCRLSGTAGLTIVGAYPTGQEVWDLKRGDNPADYELAITEIPEVAQPNLDPVYGESGPLLELWNGPGLT